MISIRFITLLLLLILTACTNNAQPEPGQTNKEPNFTNMNSTGGTTENGGATGDTVPDTSPDSGNTSPNSTNTDDRKRVMILVQSGQNPESILKEYGGEVEQSYVELNMAAGLVTVDQLERMKQDARIVHIEIDKPVELKPAQLIDWGGVAVQVPNALASNFTGKGIKIAVIDTGIAAHDDLAISGGVSFVDYTTSYQDDNGHGTHVAGVIGARNNDIGVVGVAPESDLYAVKVLEQDGTGYLSDVIAGIDWAIQQGIDVINLSLGSPASSPLLETIINRAASENIVIVSASGNDGTTAGTEDNVEYPARYPNVIAIGAVDNTNKRAYFSSTGPSVELVAPGVNILSIYIENSYARMDGTSSATPHVSGIIALLKQINPTITLTEIRSKLQKASLDLGNPGKDTWYGFGLAQAPYFFRDIYGHWARADILAAYDKEWMVGMPNQSFYPNRSMTRAEGAVILQRILGLSIDVLQPLPFSDISPTNWAYDEISVVYEQGYMLGTGANRFQPTSQLTREQMVAMLSRILPTEPSDVDIPFTDVRASRWSYPAIASMYGRGLIYGISDTKFAPTKPITRAEMAAILTRLSPYLEGTVPTYVN